MKVNRELRIGELARRTGVSQRLLRDYEEQGLLRPARLANAGAITQLRAAQQALDNLLAAIPPQAP